MAGETQRTLPLKRVIQGIVLVIAAFIAYEVWYYSRTQWVPAGSVGVIYDASGGLQKRVISPRSVYVGWRQQLYTYPTQLQAAIYTQDPQEGEEKTADGILITTNDNANTTFDVAVIYRVRPEDVIKVFNAFGPIPIEDIQVQHIRRAVKEAVNVIGPRYDVFALMGPKRQEASDLATKELQALLAPKGITVEHVLLGGCFPSSDVQTKITTRVNALTDLEISRLRGQLAEIQKQTELVRAQADAAARKMSAAQVQGKGIEMLRLETAQAAVKKWDGQLPRLESKPGQTVILGSGTLEQSGAVRGQRNDQ